MDYRVLIVDDEPKIIQLIKQLGHWKELGIDIIGECHDGKMALESILEERPDFVLSDIKMPVYDGIQLIEKARESNLDTLFILLSGYRHFEYARSAISLNVMDYLLKPIDEKQLNDTLEKVCHRIKQMREQKDKHERLELWEVEQSDKELGVFWRMLLNKEQEEVKIFEMMEESACNETYHTDFEQGCYQVLCTVSDLNGMLELNDSLFSDKVKGFIQKSFKEFAKVHYYTTFQGHIIILNFPKENKKENKKEIKNAISALFYQIRELNEIYGDFRFNIGCSSTKNASGELVRAFEEANAAGWGKLIFLGSNITEYNQIRGIRKFEVEEVISLKERELLAESIQFLRDEEMSDLFAKLYKRSAKFNQESPESMQAVFYSLSTVLLSAITDSDSRERLKTQYYYAYLEAKKFQDIFQNLFHLFEKYMQEEHKRLKEKFGKPLGEAVRYMKKNYRSQISQEDVAEAANVSTGYLSKLFKEEMKIGFNEYLIQTRMEESKRLLADTNLSIRQIAELTGYLDEKYFSKTFKKVNGIKPTDYRRLYG